MNKEFLKYYKYPSVPMSFLLKLLKVANKNIQYNKGIMTMTEETFVKFVIPYIVVNLIKKYSSD